MKKLILLVVLFLTGFTLLSLKTSAVDFAFTEVPLLETGGMNPVYDFGEVLTGDNTGNMYIIISGEYPCSYDKYFYPAIASYIKVVLPSEDWYDTSVMQVVFGTETLSYVKLGEFADFVPFQENTEYSYRFDLSRTFFTYDISDTGEFVLYLECNFDYDTPPEADFENYFIAHSTAVFGYMAMYYNLFVDDGGFYSLYSRIIKGFGEGITAVELGTPTYTDKILVGYVTEDGYNIRLQNITISDFFADEDGYANINLYAKYLYINETLTPTETPEQTTVLGEILSMFRGDNPTGYSIVYLLITVLITIVFLFKKWAMLGFALIHFVLTVVLWVTGLIQMFVIIPVMLIYVITVFETVKRAKGEVVQNE